MHILYPLLWLFLLCLLGACTHLSQDPTPSSLEHLSEVQIDSVLEQIDFSYESPVELDSSDFIIFPLSAYNPTQWKSKSDLLSLSESRYSELYTGHWNLLFFHPESHENHLLTQSRMLISEYLVNLPDAGPKLSRSILLKVRDQDVDADGRISLVEPESLYWVQQDGKGLERISPENEDLVSYKILSDTDEIIYQTQQFSIREGKLIYEDSYSWYYVNLSNGNTSTRILAPEDEKEIERLFFDQWVKSPNE